MAGRDELDVVVIGGGLAGLACATYLARGRQRVVLLERAPALGGRAATETREGFRLNLGAHALYRGGAATRGLDELGVARSGRPPPRGGTAWVGGGLRRLPAGRFSLIFSRLGSFSERRALAEFFTATLPAIDVDALAGVPARAWAEEALPAGTVRDLVLAFLRLATYANAPDRLSAGVALRYLRAATEDGVEYLDGGWETLVEGVAEKARKAGVDVRTRARARAVKAMPFGPRVELEGKPPLDPRWGVVLALGPAQVLGLLGEDAPAASREALGALTPVKARGLDLGLARLPFGASTFVLGVDEPLYLSVHTEAAHLGPPHAALVHLVRYLAPGDPITREESEESLARLADAALGSWRDRVVVERPLGEVVVTHALPEAAAGGLAGRPPVRLPGGRGLYACGDWVGPEGYLLDACMASARAAAVAVIEDAHA